METTPSDVIDSKPIKTTDAQAEMSTETGSQSGTSSEVDAVTKSEVMKKADELLAQGKRNMVCGEVPKAVNLFEEAVKLLVKSFGEMSRDCADAYFNCGSALLELCRMETNVLGTALDGVEVEEEKDEAESEQFEKPPADDAEIVKNGTAEGEDTAEDAEDAEDTTEDQEDAESENEENGAEDKDGDAVGNFQLAWEYLDLAKVIYCKKEEKNDQLKAAECLIKLGELSMETEQYETASKDLESALNIQKKYLSEDDRIIAETHYQLGLAFGLGKEFEKAIEQYQSAIKVIEAKIVSLTKLVEAQEVDAENKENRETDDLSKYKEEIKELKDLIPEMLNKIEDTRVEQKDMDKMKDMAREMLGLSGTSKGFGSPKKTEASGASSASRADVDENGEKKASDIAHLVRKKRKPEESISAEHEVKKIRQENDKGDMGASEASGASSVVENGQMNGHVNGHASPTKSSEPATLAEPMAT